MTQKSITTVVNSNSQRNFTFTKRGLVSLIGGFFTTLIAAFPVQAAEDVSLTFGNAKITVSVEALEAYANSGTVDPKLRSFLLILNGEDQEQFKNVLLDPHKIDSVMLSQFLNSRTGDIFLRKLGNIIQAERNLQDSVAIQNGSEAIKTALIKSSQEPEGITLLNILRQFPNPEIQLNIQHIFQLRSQVNDLLEETNAVVAEIVKLSSEEMALAPTIDYSKKRDLKQSGDFQVNKKTLTLKDTQRNRELVVDLYIPSPLSAVKRGKVNSIPIIMISHGLAANRANFAYLGEHLASHGFLAVLPQHPGSDTDQLQAWLSGQVSDGFQVTEFIDRPLDIHFILNELEARNASEFNGQLNLQKVGVAGHSFGAYTALAVAGAKIDFNNLRKECTHQFNSINLAQIFQCRALELPEQTYNFRDERVKAIVVMNPVNSSIFGQQSLSKISIPVFWKTSGKDTVAPVAWEQVRSFTWLTTRQKYLLLAEGDRHINLNLNLMNQTLSASLKEIVAPVPEPVTEYIRAFSLAFFEAYVREDQTYKSYLNASYAKTISQEPYPLSLVHSLSAEQFLQVLESRPKTRSSEPN